MRIKNVAYLIILIQREMLIHQHTKMSESFTAKCRYGPLKRNWR